MRSGEERLAAMHRRAEELSAERRKRNGRISAAVGILGLAAVLAVLVSGQLRPAAQLPAGTAPGTMQGSLLSGSGMLGYIVLAILAFLLGVFFTVFCYRLKRRQDRKEDEDERG